MTSRGSATTGASAPSATMLSADELRAAAGATGNRSARSSLANTCNVGQLVALRPAPSPPANTSAPVVSGTAREGETLTASTGSWSGSPTSFGYQWQLSGDGGASWADIAGATGTSYVLTPADVGSVVRVVVTASNAGGSGTASSAPTSLVLPAPPASVSPPLVSGVAREGETLTASTGSWSGSPTAFAYQWQRSGDGGASWADIAGSDADSYVLASEDVGSVVRVVVTASNAGGSGSAPSEPTPVVDPMSPPSNVAPPVISGIAREGELLSASTGSWTGPPTTYSYSWARCDQNGENCASVSWADASDHRLREEDVGFTVVVEVTASNSAGSASATSEPTDVVLPLPPANEAPPTVSGVPEEGEVLTATSGIWRSAAPVSYAYQWQSSPDGGASWVDIDGAASSSYSLTSGEVGLVMRVVVTASNVGGPSSAPSAATATVGQPGPPINVMPPSFSGYAQDGAALTAFPGVWSGSPTAYAYQWQRSTDGGQTWTDVADAVSPTYSLTGADVGAAVRVVVTASNDLGSATMPSHSADVYPTGNLVVLVNQQWRCDEQVDVDLVRVTMITEDSDAVSLASGCTGRIGRVEIVTHTQDAIKTQNSNEDAAHDLVIESGWARCPARSPGAHQDGLQNMGGRNITIRNFVWACGDMADPYGSGVAQAVVISRAGSEVTTPTDVVVEHSVLMPGAAHTFAIGESLRSGIRDSVLCPDRTGASPISDYGGAVDPVFERNEEPELSDPRCSSFDAALAWAQGVPAP
jgi:hypothetical protein